jgi:ABC-2 type transport system ATP-binding protein
MDHGRILQMDTPAALVRGLDAPVHVYVAPHQLTLEAARELPGVDETHADDTSVVLSTRTPSAVLARLAELDALEGLQVRAATLEDVFLNLTGREYRA